MPTEPEWTVELIDELLEGEWVNRRNFRANHVAVSRRSSTEQSLFVAMSDETFRQYMGGCNFVYFAEEGRSFDNHHAASRAAQDGQAAALIVEEELPVSAPQLIVPDGFAALESLASYRRSEIQSKVVAVTGTVGKTSTVRALQTLFGDQGEKLSTSNVRRSLALGMANAPTGTPDRVLVAEISISGFWGAEGGISKVVRPDVALLTHIGLGMTHKAPTERDTAIDKTKIINYLSSHGVLLYNADMKHTDYVKDYAGRLNVHALSYGYKDNADYKVASEAAVGEAEALVQDVELDSPTGTSQLSIPAFGRAHVYSNVAAFAVAEALGKDLDVMSENMQQYVATHTAEKVSRVTDTSRGTQHTIIDGTFSATPQSMENALRLASDVHAATPSDNRGDLVAVLGRIVALGDHAQAVHAELIAPIRKAGFDRVYTYGEDLEALVVKLQEHGMHAGHYDSTERLAEGVAHNLSSHSTILMKGSKRASDFRDVRVHLHNHLSGGDIGVTISVFGEVHDLGFRKWARGRAKIYGLRGWARNNGRKVEIRAHGPKREIGQFLLDCQTGPETASVTRISFTPTTRQPPEGFRIRRTITGATIVDTNAKEPSTTG